MQFLPQECVEHIIYYLPAKDIISVSMTCKEFSIYKKTLLPLVKTIENYVSHYLTGKKLRKQLLLENEMIERFKPYILTQILDIPRTRKECCVFLRIILRKFVVAGMDPPEIFSLIPFTREINTNIHCKLVLKNILKTFSVRELLYVKNMDSAPMFRMSR
jgi:hypothetical protein